MKQLTKQDIIEVFKFRSATRYYDPTRKISDEDFNAILEFGRLSPSSVGSEPWKFIVVQDKALREKLKPFSWGMAGQLDDCSHLVILLAKKNARFDTPFFFDVAKRRGLTDEQIIRALVKYQQFQQDDMKIADDERALFDWSSKQTYIALANMMTGAAFMGIDSCPVEGFNYEQMDRVLAETGAYDPNEYAVSVAVTFGYRAREITPKKRKTLDEIVTWIK
ncbi:NAD(P)H-dependent oxidoreductase [Rodentibacter caecimuris]|uniref:NAD(P)H-dependent oxidoreductase n=1 Tax=Rodentibacter caecimuris TaxID=1796644 RepID=A0ABX3KYV6_9PAST|nr:NAD(P)H-dependent oxidoreductase [Rodentibacter heylii]